MKAFFMALIFGLAQMKVNCEEPIHNLFMQPTHQKKALWMHISMPWSEIGYNSFSGQDRHFQGVQKWP